MSRDRRKSGDIFDKGEENFVFNVGDLEGFIFTTPHWGVDLTLRMLSLRFDRALTSKRGTVDRGI
jgi:hypothetical protein